MLFLLLILLNIVVRIPSIPHEKGLDSFFIHALANSVSIFGKAQWWLNWESVFGLYPYSYASAVPFALSGISQLSGLEMEKAILVYCVTIGLFSIFTTYLFAERLNKDFIFKYFMALIFSLASGVMVFTTWEVSTRGLFIVMFPLYLYLLMRENLNFKKYLLLLILLVFIFATHHYAYFLIPPTGIYIVFNLLKDMKIPYVKESHLKYIIIFIILYSLIAPFNSRSLIESGSRYQWVLDSLLTNVRYIGPISIFIVSGLIYLVDKHKNFNEYFMLFIIAIYLQTFYSQIYGPFLLVLPLILLANIGFNNLFNVWAKKSNKKVISAYIIVIFLLFVSFSTFFNHYRTGNAQYFWFMKDDAYHTGIWGKEYIPDNSKGIDDGYAGRIFATSEGHPRIPTLDANDLAYGFVNVTNIQMVANSPTSSEYYFDGPYSIKDGTSTSGAVEWLREEVRNINEIKGFDYYLETKGVNIQITTIVQKEANRIFDCNGYAIWKI